MADGSPCRCGRGTLYDVLQVSPWCEPEVIQAAYRALARSRHPDLNRDPDAEDQMRRLNAAYQTLIDPVQRARYDEELVLESAARAAPTRPSTAAGQKAWSASTGASKNTSSGGGPAGAGRPNARASRPAAEPATPYQAGSFDVRSEGLLSRSALYIAVVLVTVVLSLFAYIVIDVVSAEGPITTPRGSRIQGERTWTPSSSSGTWVLDRADGESQPGLSPSGERWNR